jgi:biotin operon repressor
LKYQRFVSLSAGLSFIVVFISSGVLYFIPDRKVTGWTDWTFLGIDKQQWDNLHINLGIFFLIMIVWHIYYNWKPIKNYLKVKKELKIFTKEFNVALIFVLLFCVGTLKMVLPFSFLVNVGNGIKAINSLSDGNPPFGYAEYATLKDFSIINGINLEEATTLLNKNGININSKKDTLKKIAMQNDISPKKIFSIIKPLSKKQNLPSELPIGIAHKSLEKLANEYDFDIQKALQHLKSYGINISKTTNFKKIAKEHNLHPAQLYNMLLASQVE